VGVFSHKFLAAPSGKTTDRIKKVRGAKMRRTSSLTVPSMVGNGRTPAENKKSDVFLSVFLSRFEMTKVCDNGNAINQCNFQNNYDVIA